MDRSYGLPVSRALLEGHEVFSEDIANLWHGFHILRDYTSFLPAMVSLQMARELGVDGQRRLYADNQVTGLVGDSSN